MRAALTALFSVLVVISSLAASMGFGSAWQRFMPSALGDARMGCQITAPSVTNISFNVKLPSGSHDEATISGWLRLHRSGGWDTGSLSAWITYTPEPIRVSNPSLAFADAYGYPTNMTVSGSVAKDPFPWKPYDPGFTSNSWPRGVYTVAGWASNAVTVSVGGAEVSFPAGEFNRNVIPGNGSGVTVTTTGQCRIGISRTPDSQWFWGNAGRLVEDGWFSDDTSISNELAFIVWRLRMTPSNQVCRISIARPDLCSSVNAEFTSSLPRHVTKYHSEGRYMIGCGGIKRQRSYDVDWFDVRTFGRWLSDDELCRIRDNGADEIARRGIPRWR